MANGESKCKSCGAPVLWVTMIRKDGTVGKKNCLDTVPSRSGNIARKAGKFTDAWYGQVVDQSTIGTKPLYTSHFMTCPEAGFWRKA